MMVDTKKILHRIKVYEERSGESFFLAFNYIDYPDMILLDNGEFLCYKINGSVLNIGPTSGSEKILKAMIMDIAKQNGCKLLETVTIRNPNAYTRLTKAKLFKTYKYPDTGVYYYYFRLEVQ